MFSCIFYENGEITVFLITLSFCIEKTKIEQYGKAKRYFEAKLM